MRWGGDSRSVRMLWGGPERLSVRDAGASTRRIRWRPANRCGATRIVQAVLDLVHRIGSQSGPQLAERSDDAVHSGAKWPGFKRSRRRDVAPLSRRSRRWIDCANATAGGVTPLLSETAKLRSRRHWIMTLITHGGVTNETLARLLDQHPGVVFRAYG